MRVHPLIATASLMLVAAAAAACSTGSAAPPSAGGNPNAASSTTGNTRTTGNSGNSGSSGGAATKNINVCTVLPAATATQITGTTFNKAKSSNVEGVVFGCEYDGPNSALLQISVAVQGGQYVYSGDVTAMKTVGHAPTAISGVGDKAFSTPDPNGNAGAAGAAAFASYGALFGQDYIKIGGLTYVTAAQGKQIVELIHAKL